MTYVTDPLGFIHCAPIGRDGAHRGILRRMFDGMFEVRQRRADRDIAAYIAHSGGRLTDSIERELMERFSKPTFEELR